MDPPVEHLEFDHLIKVAVMDQQTAPAVPDVGYSALSRETSHSGAHTYSVNCEHPNSDPQYHVNNQAASGGRLSDVTTPDGFQVDGVAMLDGAVHPNKSGGTSTTVGRHDDCQHNCLRPPSHPLTGRAGTPAQPPDDGISQKPALQREQSTL